uniref:Intradiol ring-cleavage dioxygenase n=1 Tax=Tetranychus cinnabarinus TaxID=93129 RepID=A0A286R6Y3_TETCI|nr:intradiol ring-cleavage dioxygenase [Tetranychus cinnabarinus]
MNKSVIPISILLICFNIVFVSAHLERPGKLVDHDRTVTNCARYKREANQHACVLAPFTTEGPYFLPDDFERSDITDGQVGIPLDLTIRLTNASDCLPLSDLYVHIWNANSTGHYSGVQEFNSFPEPTYRPKPIDDVRFLRGFQKTNEHGEVNFKTILPGWYYARCLHIHVEVYHKAIAESDSITYIGQLYFKRELPTQLRLVEPYSQNTNEILLNEQDRFFAADHGQDNIIELKSQDGSYTSYVTLGIDPDIMISVQ